jgi:hypothetical protein
VAYAPAGTLACPWSGACATSRRGPGGGLSTVAGRPPQFGLGVALRVTVRPSPGPIWRLRPILRRVLLSGQPATEPGRRPGPRAGCPAPGRAATGSWQPSESARVQVARLPRGRLSAGAGVSSLEDERTRIASERRRGIRLRGRLRSDPEIRVPNSRSPDSRFDREMGREFQVPILDSAGNN